VFKIKNNIQLITMVVIILMVFQVLVVLFISTGRKAERFSNQAGEALLASVISMDELFEYGIESAVALSSVQDVINLMYSDVVTQDDMLNFSHTTANVQRRQFESIQALFVYNEYTNTVYGNDLNFALLDNIPVSPTKEIIISNKNYGKKFAYLVDSASFFTEENLEKSEQVLRFRIFPSRQNRSCLLMDTKLSAFNDFFAAFSRNFSSGICITDEDGSVFYSTDQALENFIASDLESLEKENFNEPVFRRYNSEKYLIVKQKSGSSTLTVYGIIPDSAIKVDYRETKMILLTNLSLIVALCIFVTLFFIFRFINEALKENSRHRQLAEQEKSYSHFIKNKQHLANCLFRPSEQDIRLAKECIDDFTAGDIQTGKRSSLSVLRFEIFHFDRFCEKHSSKDVQLFKYGIVNICEEILNQYVKSLYVYERDEEFVFIVISEDNYRQCIENAYQACQEAIISYIDESVSAYLSYSGNIEELSELHQQTIQLAEYKFLLEKAVFLHADFLALRGQLGTSDMMEQLDEIFVTAERNMVEQKMNEFFDLASTLTIDDAKNALWILMFRLYNTGKKNAKITVGIENLVSQFNEAQHIGEMKVFFLDLCHTVFPSEDSSDEIQKNQTVQTVLSIIERRFREPGFSSDDVAEEMNFSKAYLSRKFRQAAEISISDAINDRRLEEFARYLVSSEKSVKSIINDIGGTNPNYYMAIFKKKFQMTPTEYRQTFGRKEEN